MSVAPAEQETYILNASTLCDRCSGRAYVLAFLQSSKRLPRGGELLLCGHHANEHLAAMGPLIHLLVDERDSLNAHIKDDGHVN